MQLRRLLCTSSPVHASTLCQVGFCCCCTWLLLSFAAGDLLLWCALQPCHHQRHSVAAACQHPLRYDSLVASHTFLPCRFLPAVLPRLSHCKALPVMALHGKMKQAARAATLSAFAEAPSGEQLTLSMCCYGPLAVWFRFSSLPLLPMLAVDPLRGIHWPMQACCCARMWLRGA